MYVLLVGEAAAELLDTKQKPKTAIKRQGEAEIIYDTAPKRKPLNEIEENLKNQLTECKDTKKFS